MKEHTKDNRLAFDTSPGALQSGYKISAKVVPIEPAIKPLAYPACLAQQCKQGRRRCETPDFCNSARARWFHSNKWANRAIAAALIFAAIVLVIVVPDWASGKRPHVVRSSSSNLL